MSARPSVWPVTSPLEFTVATAGVRLVHVTGTPTRCCCSSSSTSTCRRTGQPGGTRASDRRTYATREGCTLIVAVPLWPSLVAVTVAVPAAIPRAIVGVESVTKRRTVEESLLDGPPLRDRFEDRKSTRLNSSH